MWRTVSEVSAHSQHEPCCVRKGRPSSRGKGDGEQNQEADSQVESQREKRRGREQSITSTGVPQDLPPELGSMHIQP